MTLSPTITVNLDWEKIKNSLKPYWKNKHEKYFPKKSSIQKIVKIILKNNPFKIDDKVYRLDKREFKLSHTVEITKDKKIFLLLKDHFAEGQYKRVSRCFELTEGIITAQSTVTLQTKAHKSMTANEIEFANILKESCFANTLYINQYTSNTISKVSMMMPYYNAGSMKDIISNREQLDSNNLISLFYDCLKALVILEKKGIRHRDLKPENIFVSKNKQGVMHAHIGDFGLMSFLSDDQGKLILCGTMPYWAPEQTKLYYQYKKVHNLRNKLKSQLQVPKQELLSPRSINRIEHEISKTKETSLIIISNFNGSKIALNQLLQTKKNLKTLNKKNYYVLRSELLRVHNDLQKEIDEMEDDILSKKIKLYKLINIKKDQIILKMEFKKYKEKVKKSNNIKTDIWPLGIILLQLRTCFDPNKLFDQIGIDFILNVDLINTFFNKSLKEPPEHQNIKTLEELNRAMLNINPEKRPTASQCLEIFNKLRKNQKLFS